MTADKIGKIRRIAGGEEKLAKLAPEQTPQGKNFETYMKKEQVAQVDKVTEQASDRPSLMDEVRKANMGKKIPEITTEGISTQTKQAIGRIDRIKRTLASADIQLRDSVHPLLNRKLDHVQENLKVALSKIGVDYTPPVAPKEGFSGPIEKYLGLLTNAQTNLESLEGDISKMHALGKDLSPANMLALQIKVAYITQELEFFSNFLNKQLEATKTLLNVQV